MIGYTGPQCVCKEGFEGTGQECSEKQNPCEKCSRFARCVPDAAYGSGKKCVCNRGYVGDGLVKIFFLFSLVMIRILKK